MLSHHDVRTFSVVIALVGRFLLSVGVIGGLFVAAWQHDLVAVGILVVIALGALITVVARRLPVWMHADNQQQTVDAVATVSNATSRSKKPAARRPSAK